MYHSLKEVIFFCAKSCVVFGMKDCEISGQAMWDVENLTEWADFDINLYVNGVDGHCAPTDVDPQNRPWIDRSHEKQKILQEVLLPLVTCIKFQIPNRNRKFLPEDQMNGDHQSKEDKKRYIQRIAVGSRGERASKLLF